MIQFLNSSTGARIVIFSCKETNRIWISAKEIAGSFGYRNTRNAIRRLISLPNRKTLETLVTGTELVAPSGLQKNQIFINSEGLTELIQYKPNHPAHQAWLELFSSFSNTARKETLESETGKVFDGEEKAFPRPTKLYEIPDTVTKQLSMNGTLC